MTVDFSDLKEFKKQLERVEKEFNSFLYGFLLEQALRALAKTKKNHPVITGLMRASWQISDVKRSGNNLEVWICNYVNYSGYVEYGHMTAKRDKWVEGRFMCTIAIAEVEREMQARWDRQFGAWIKSMGL